MAMKKCGGGGGTNKLKFIKITSQMSRPLANQASNWYSVFFSLVWQSLSLKVAKTSGTFMNMHLHLPQENKLWHASLQILVQIPPIFQCPSLN